MWTTFNTFLLVLPPRLTLILLIVSTRGSSISVVHFVHVDKEEQAIIDGWDCGFATDTHKVASSDNEASLGELLGGFFVFYSNVDFTKVVICPREGRMVPVAEFQQTISSDDRVAGFKVIYD